jgi:predicted nucleic acid-binding protein
MATTDAKQPVFLDTNVLIYASIKEAPEHQTLVTANTANIADFARFTLRLKLIDPRL